MSANQFGYDLATGGAATQSINEANRTHQNNTYLPGRENGPADAYRHILLSAELTRKYGEDYARALLEGHEWTGNNGGQTGAAESMDRHNNELGIEIGKRMREFDGGWEDVIRKSRRLIDASKNGDLDSARWLPEEFWQKNPVDDSTKKRMANDDPRLAVPPLWQDLPLTNYDKNPYGDYDLSPFDWPYFDIFEKLQEMLRSASEIPSPIVLDLDGDGVETISVANSAWFDHAADGFAERTGWASSDDGLLVRDLDVNGTIDSGRELFGSETLLPNGTKAANGFESLKALDTNTDGVINAQDAAFPELRVWKDANANGRTDAGEMLTLAEAGVGSINVAYTNSSHIDAQGNAHRQVGSYATTNRDTRTATDIWVQTNTTQSLPTDWVDVPEAIAALPDAQGYGLVRDLHQAMAMDATDELKALVEAFTQATTPQDRDYLVTQLIYHWAGVQDIDPASRASRMIYGNATVDTCKLKSSDNDMNWIAGNLNRCQSMIKYRKPQTIIKTQEMKSFHH